MPLSIQSRAVGCAVLAAMLSLCGTGLTAFAIQKLSHGATVAEIPTDISTSPEIVAKGKEYFAMSCSQCHGDDAHGDEGPDLHNLAISNGRIAATIKKGIKGEMPTFAKKYDDQQIAVIVSYLRTLH